MRGKEERLFLGFSANRNILRWDFSSISWTVLKLNKLVRVRKMTNTVRNLVWPFKFWRRLRPVVRPTQFQSSAVWPKTWKFAKRRENHIFLKIFKTRRKIWRLTQKKSSVKQNVGIYSKQFQYGVNWKWLFWLWSGYILAWRRNWEPPSWGKVFESGRCASTIRHTRLQLSRRIQVPIWALDSNGRSTSEHLCSDSRRHRHTHRVYSCWHRILDHLICNLPVDQNLYEEVDAISIHQEIILNSKRSNCFNFPSFR